MKNILALVLVNIILVACKPNYGVISSYQSENLKIEKISENVFKHISYIEIPDYGKFPCNGLIFVNNNEAIVFDTPIDNPASAELIDWLTQKERKKIKGVIINHFHNDCLGGLNEFHKNGIKSYANNKTVELASKNNETLPQIAFQDSLELKIGKQSTITKYYGSGHTYDNVVSYIPTERILFGGCLIKYYGAGKGNLADANIEQWPKTVKLLKKDFIDIKIVVPGHGKSGGMELLDYTIELFTEK